jgi:phage/plasmid-like protein (TIGR03299 family)
MSHNITSTDGLVLFKEAAWHGLGTVVENEIGPKEALVKAGLDYPIIMLPNVQAMDAEGNVYTSDREQAACRTDTGAILGVHKSRYKPVQNDQLFDIAYAMGDQVKVESAGSFDAGRKVFLALRGGTLGLKWNDESVSYLVLSNSHDGSSKMSATPSSVRVVCNNTLDLMWYKDGQRSYSIRHDGSVEQKIVDLKKALQAFQQDSQAWVDHGLALQGKTLTHTEMVTFWGEIYSRNWGLPSTAKEKETAAQTLERWESILETERAYLAYGDVDLWLATNAITNDLQHATPMRVRAGWQGRQVEKNWFGDNAKKTSQIFQQALKAI